jgi:hypothetical protein
VTVFFLLSRLSKTADSVDSPNEDSIKIEIHPKMEKETKAVKLGEQENSVMQISKIDPPSYILNGKGFP